MKQQIKTDCAYELGDAVFIRTATMYLTGRIVGIYDMELVLEDAAWICDTGRFADFLKTGKANEVEPVDGKVVVSRFAVVDCFEWKHKLPREQK